ncbi:MAG: 4-alpha-glucanotransferase, partial [Myxococcota bacterium]
MNHHIDTLEELATEMGVLTSYNDWTGETRRADPEILVRIFAMLGAEINLLSDAPAALRAWRVAKARQTLPPCVVSWERTAAMLPLRLPRHLAGSYGIEVLLESGAIRRYDGSLDEVPARPIDSPEGDGYVERSLTIPVGEFGYHQVIARMPGQTARCMLIAAPRAGFNRDVGKRWGVFAPLYSLHSQHSGGAGDLGDLLRIAQQTGELGASFVGTLPLLASFLDEPYEYSPYSPVSRMFWNELYLDPTTAPGFDRCAAAQTLLSASDYVAETAELRAMKRVDYRRQMAHKRRVLELLADTAW